MRNRARIARHLLSLVLLAVSSAACSVNTYKPAVDRFGTAMQQARDAYGKMEAVVLASRTEALRKDVLGGKLRVSLKPNTCNVQSASCELLVIGNSKAEPLHPKFENINLLLGELTDYAANLRAIVASDTPQQVTASFGAASGSIKSLSASVAKISGKPDEVSAFVEPSANIAGWIVGEFVNALQVSALRKATARADGVVQRALPILQESATASANVINAGLAKRVEELKEAQRLAPADRQALDRLDAAARELDTALKATSPAVFADMAAAHRDLTAALSGSRITLEDAYAAIQQFATKAEALYKMIAALEAAAKPPAKQ